MRFVTALPQELQTALTGVSPAILNQVQEVRLRVGCPLTLSLPNNEVELHQFSCTGESLAGVFQHLCEFSVHSHQAELRQGYISTRSGCRVGVAGTAVVENGEIVSIRNITSLCIRVRREHPNCARQVVDALTADGRLRSALICGEPASGKTSLLRDIAVSLSVGHSTNRPFRLSVIDERGELFPDFGTRCDVLVGYPKAQGIEQAVRTLAPECVIFDELGDMKEVQAVLRCLNSGVRSVTTVHADSLESLNKRVVGRVALLSGAFDYVILLSGRKNPGQIKQIISVKEALC